MNVHVVIIFVTIMQTVQTQMEVLYAHAILDILEMAGIVRVSTAKQV